MWMCESPGRVGERSEVEQCQCFLTAKMAFSKLRLMILEQLSLDRF